MSGRPTYADIEALPEHVVGEIIDGELVVSPRPAPRHALAASVLGSILLPPYSRGIGGPGGWWILHEPELSLGVDADYDPVVPDLAGWKLTTMDSLPDAAQFPVVPDWVCEVLSPGTAMRDRVKKLPFYARAGVGHAWLLDPVLEMLEGFARGDDGTWRLETVAGGQDRVRIPPFEAIELDVTHLWSPPVGVRPEHG